MLPSLLHTPNVQDLWGAAVTHHKLCLFYLQLTEEIEVSDSDEENEEEKGEQRRGQCLWAGTC